ncbi:FtsK/SpoIIIE domain-containing protein [Raineyella fluvialis]|uniref:FtsK/SpoIIIE domain-containing protein n=1 Tax=Raineyella fluvialis TaxID=2662261 RepID=UPI00188FD4B3|nr:FtsK/SpoIIIE domain-containing protein [Raineyella fluvialis]
MDVRRRVATLKGRLESVSALIPALAEATSAADERELALARARAESQREAQLDSVIRRFEADSRRGMTGVVDLSRRLAPGWASAICEGSWSPQEVSIPADFVRVGAIPHETVGGVPLIVPMVNHPGLVLSGAASATDNLALSLAARLFAQSPLKHVVLEVFDPKVRGTLGTLTGLRAGHPGAFPPPTVDASSFAGRLDAVMQSAVRNVELSRLAGVSSLTDLWRLRGTPEGTLHLVVILDYPYAVDRALQERLLRIATIGGPSGTSLLVVVDPTAVPDREVIPDELIGRLTLVEVGADTVRVPGYPCDGVPDPALRPDFVEELVRGVGASARLVQGPTIPLESLMPDDVEVPWAHSAEQSLDVVVGRTGREPLTISLRTENPPHPNILIGGAVGQGKSNLVLDIIYGLAVRYSPQELELYLLDFKRGLEFKRFAPDPDGRHWLPHVRVLSLESNQAFGVAVLRSVDDEMERRSQLFKQVGANSLNSYRTLTCSPMPRLLLVVDEFHVLFEGEDRYVDQAVELMDRLAKQGRAYGIHLLLASQTTSGVRGLAIKGNSIFAQFPLRLSLKNTAAESQAILSEGNTAAADLSYRGEVVLNRNFGSDPEGSNVRGMAAYAEPDRMAALQARLWEQGHGEMPMVFVGREYAAWDSSRDHVPEAHGRGLSMMLGRPVAVTREPVVLTVDQDADQTVALVGSDVHVAAAAVNSLVRSAIPTLVERGGSVVILDGLEEGAWLDALAEDVRGAGVGITRVPRADIAGHLTGTLGPAAETAGRGDDRPPLLVVGLGLQRARGMDQAPSTSGFDIDFGFDGDATTGRGVLRRLAREGALMGAHLLGWWSSLRALESDLGMAHDGVAHYVTVGLGLEELRAVAGAMTPPIDGSPRVGWFDRNGDSGLVTVVPFHPDQFRMEDIDG